MSLILAIDDKQDNLISISAILRHFIPGCTVITAASGLEGLRKARQDQPDTILLDLHMPGMDGFEVCEKLKQHPKTRQIPIVMLTAVKTDSKSRVKGLELGADAFLSKPVDEVELAAQVKAMLRIKRAEGLLRRERDALEELVRKQIRDLRESEANYKNLFEQSNDAIFIHDLEGSILDCNQFACKMLGYPKDRLLSMKLSSLHTREMCAVSEYGFQETLENDAFRFEARFLRADKGIIDVETSSAIIDKEKGIVQSIVRDITTRKTCGNLPANQRGKAQKTI